MVEVAQQEDPVIRMVVNWVLCGKKIPAGKIRYAASELKPFWKCLALLRVRDGILYKKDTDFSQHNREWLVVPQSLIPEVLKAAHENPTAGHLGQDKTTNNIRHRFFWPGWQSDVRRYCNECHSCAVRKSPTPKPRAPLNLILATRPFQFVVIDFQGPLPTSSRGKKHILVLQCKFSKYVEAYALANQEATTVADIMVGRFIPHFGLPEIIHTDQGANFTSKLITSLCSLLQIKKTKTAPYTPRCNGQVERVNKTIAESFAVTTKQCCSGNVRNWDRYLPLVCMAYNTAQHSSTKFPPAFLVYGRLPRTPMDVMFGSSQTAVQGNTVDEYAVELHKRILTAFQEVRRNQIAASDRQKKSHDKKIRGTPFVVGDSVYLERQVFAEGESKKFSDKWLGPYFVVKVMGPVTYEVHCPSSGHRTVANFSDLKRGYSRMVDPVTEASEDTSRKDTVTSSPKPSTSLSDSDSDEDLLAMDECYQQSAASTRPALRSSLPFPSSGDNISPSVAHSSSVTAAPRRSSRIPKPVVRFDPSP